MAQKGPVKRKPKVPEPEPEEKLERYMLTYSDMITLLMTLFVILYAMAKVDTAKYNALAESLSEAFSSVSGVQIREGDGGHSLSALDTTLKPAPGTGLSPKVSSKKDNFLEKARSTLDTSIKTGKIHVSTEARGIVLALAGDTYFKPASAELDEGAVDTLAQIAALLRDLPNPLAVEGHSDNMPTSRGDRYESNLMLSAARAVAVAETLELLDVPKERLSATGFGDAKPAQPNDTPEHRAENRRVEILIRFDAES
jgi:chemotaxis protein MotB